MAQAVQIDALSGTVRTGAFYSPSNIPVPSIHGIPHTTPGLPSLFLSLNSLGALQNWRIPPRGNLQSPTQAILLKNLVTYVIRAGRESSHLAHSLTLPETKLRPERPPFYHTEHQGIKRN
jgi:hypothetical protein